MKSTGIVRKVDELGRIVMPIELRRSLEIAEADAVEIFIEEDKIILKKYEPYRACLITGEVKKENVEYAPGIFLSPEGAEILLQQIQTQSS
ncbi:AbrB/MazE/SpoVT family DNA-binding domain-containing protein [Planococcus sp. 1R117A]|uniref:AbrB/MazE/SpoVT family DNA-binding domain-containing protein n=1 Tax=Planococcus sp. 1R117A TaxID=3447020 RepID=UPI003EDC4A9D